MVAINLLPWREYQHAYEVSVIKKIMITILLSHTFIIFCAYLFIKEINRERQIRLNQLSTQIKKERAASIDDRINQASDFDRESNQSLIDQKISLNHLLIKDSLVQLNHAGMRLFSLVKIFNLLQKNRPPTICFTELKRNDNKWILLGKTKTIIDFFRYLKSWYGSYLFSSINLSELNREGESFQFRLFMIEKE